MCRIEKKQNDQSNKESSSKNDKIEDESFITEEITLMIKRFIDKSFEFLINLVNDHVTRKFSILKLLIIFSAIDHLLFRTSSKFLFAKSIRERNSLRRALNRFK
jgi:hypothetical protein